MPVFLQCAHASAHADVYTGSGHLILFVPLLLQSALPGRVGLPSTRPPRFGDACPLLGTSATGLFCSLTMVCLSLHLCAYKRVMPYTAVVVSAHRLMMVAATPYDPAQPPFQAFYLAHNPLLLLHTTTPQGLWCIRPSSGRLALLYGDVHTSLRLPNGYTSRHCSRLYRLLSTLSCNNGGEAWYTWVPIPCCI